MCGSLPCQGLHPGAQSGVISEARPDLPTKPISELVADPDFPNNSVGQKVDIKGYAGVIVAVVNNSIKVRSNEGNTVSYNFHTLRRIYGPRVEMETVPESMPASTPVAEPQAKRHVITQPDFHSPLVPIETLVHRNDFPACTFGVFVDLHGFTGVVVELVGRSLKIRSPDGSTRSYNGDGLRKIYGLS